ncbi:hypothetical protein [Streptomyces sp. FIT100]|nr:hypothetical protein [Streptomyces sp. FIT100]
MTADPGGCQKPPAGVAEVQQATEGGHRAADGADCGLRLGAL